MDKPEAKRTRRPAFKVNEEMYGELVKSINDLFSKVNSINLRLDQLFEANNKKDGQTVDEYYSDNSYKVFDTGAIHAVPETQEEINRKNKEMSQRNELTLKEI